VPARPDFLIEIEAIAAADSPAASNGVHTDPRVSPPYPEWICQQFDGSI
jgi:hypothetical protein